MSCVLSHCEISALYYSNSTDNTALLTRNDETLTVWYRQQKKRDGLITDAVRSSFGFICRCAPPVKPHQLGVFLKRLNPSDFYKELNDPALMEAIL